MNIALVLAGGTGTRLGGDIPKQYIEVGGQPSINYALKTLAMHERIDGIWIVANSDWHSFLWENMDAVVSKKFLGVRLPGENRQLSIVSGMKGIRAYLDRCKMEACGDANHSANIHEKDALGVEAVSGNEIMDTVFVHDAARPCLTSQMITQCYEALPGHDGVIPVLPMKDTVYLSKDGKVVSQLLNRSEVFAGQAPELFLLDKYMAANEALIRYSDNGNVAGDSPILSINGSTEPAILYGMDMAMIPGDEKNFKVTTPVDLERFRELCK